ncbi:AraC family transcriptional regulator [Nocardia stercoris]|uniref:AraC family transcriptional regulator n=1 Tax=Nocardia stercoris TaxID=2483361 RepID=A0A3M2L5H6_9NOCA|nr:AraC family transcriptional regulator [Nocardia stercoris]RMI32851.1 AraC family transcriptional regulator [Nocardia stercoris]
MTAPPGNIADRPVVQDDSCTDHRPDDLLSELLRTVRLGGERVVAYRPAPAFSIDFAEFGSVHMVEEGELELRIDGYPRIERVGPGDVVLLPRGDAHRISDPAALGETGPARWLSGTFTIGDPQASQLLSSLPPVIILGTGRAPAPEGLEIARRMVTIEMQSPTQGSAVMIARILDLIFIQILRAWAARPDAEPNWLAGAFDPQIGLSLSAIHRDPSHDWTVEELAQASHLSRSTFAARFTARVGTPPATYLAQVRLDAATDLLRDTSLSVARIADRVGYASEAAFSRAFRNRFGTPPARWRRRTAAR